MIRFLFIVLVCSCLDVYSQLEFELVQELDVKAKTFTTDQLGNIYVLNNSELIKLNLENNQQRTYSNNLFGEITSVDVSDPFRILIFNKDFNKLLYLDNNLTEIASPILLNDRVYYNVANVCQSNSGGFWLFDRNLNELVYFNQNLKQEKKSSQVSSLLDPEMEITEIYMVEKNDYIYLGIKGEGILLFDIYGSYVKTFPIKDIVQFQVIDNSIIYFDNGILTIYDTTIFNKDTLDLPVENARGVRMVQNKLYVLKSDRLMVYKLNNVK